MRVTLMANTTEWSPEKDYTTEVRVWENDYIVQVTEMDGATPGSTSETWMTRGQLETYISTLQAALELPQINSARVTSEGIKAEQEVNA